MSPMKLESTNISRAVLDGDRAEVGSSAGKYECIQPSVRSYSRADGKGDQSVSQDPVC